MADKKEKPSDEEINTKWRQMLRAFEKIIGGSPKVEDVKDDLCALKEAAKNTILTPRQAEGIVARCNNYLNGEYGKTKKPEHYSQEHNFSTNGKQA